MNPVALTVDQVAELVQCTPRTVMRAIKAGELEASQLNAARGGWRVWPDALEEWRKVRSNRTRTQRPLAEVTRIGHAAGAAKRARRQGAGSLRVTSDMGRDA